MSVPLDDHLLAEVNVQLSALLGLHFPDDRLAELERGLRKGAGELGCESALTLAAAIVAGRLGSRQLDTVAQALTIGETYFFRHPQAFRTLEEVALPAVIEESAVGRPVMIWSAGCSNGAEPYSIAISCERARRARPFDFDILATDIDRGALTQARTGRFSSWALRDRTDQFIADHFEGTDANERELHAAHRSRVTFAYDNLVGPAPGARGAQWQFDIVFCRNVLIYFSPEQRRRAATRLTAALSDGGFLFVSPSEVFDGLFSGVTVHEHGGAFYYRKGRVPDSRPKIRSTGSPRPRTRRASSVSDHGRRSPQPVAPASPLVPANPRLAQISQLADAGRADEANVLCSEVAAEMRLSADFHFLHGVVLNELNDWAGATQALQRALYLDGDLIMAHFLLGNVRLREGDERGARRHFTSALSAMVDLPDDEVVPESGGLTVAAFRELIPPAPVAQHQAGR